MEPIDDSVAAHHQHETNVAASMSEHKKGKWARSQVFRKFLLETFPVLRDFASATRLEDDGDEENDDENKQEETGAHTQPPPPAIPTPHLSPFSPPLSTTLLKIPYVLDVAGGKGDVAIPLRMRGILCGIVDPRVVKLEETKLMRNITFHLVEKGGATKTGASLMRRLECQRAFEERCALTSSSSSHASATTFLSSSSPPITAPAPPSLRGGGGAVDNDGDGEGGDAKGGDSIKPSRLAPSTVSIPFPDVFREWFVAEARVSSSGCVTTAASDGVHAADEAPSPAAPPKENRKQRRKALNEARKQVHQLLKKEAGEAQQQQQHECITDEGSLQQEDVESHAANISEKKKTSRQAPCHCDSPQLAKAKVLCDVIVGMHPDQATEPIVDFAITHRKPFAIVPCCVFPKENPHRRVVLQRSRSDKLGAEGKEATDGSGGQTDNKDASGEQQTEEALVAVPVETYEHFIEYLVQKVERMTKGAVVMKRGVLPMEGRNIVLFVDSYP